MGGGGRGGEGRGEGGIPVAQGRGGVRGGRWWPVAL